LTSNHSRTRTLLSLGAVAALVAAFALGALTRPALIGAGHEGSTGAKVARPAPAATAEANLAAQMQTFYEIVDLLQKESYYHPTDTQKLVYGADQGLMEVIGDPYTRFETPQRSAISRQNLEGTYGGIGVYFRSIDKRPTVTDPIPDTPAAKAGMLSGDIIARVDGHDTTGLSDDEVIGLIRGKEGTHVRLTIIRAGRAPFDLDLVRAVIQVPLVTTTIRLDGVAVIAVSSFGSPTTAQLDAGIRQAQGAGAKALILDLRNDGGGLVTVAQQMIGRFVSPQAGKRYNDTALYYSRARDGSNDEAVPIIRDKDAATVYDLPMVVLINGSTASAAEIVAGALADYGRATLIGTQTFGKGSMQYIHNLADGSSARITAAHWLTPNKHDINPRPTPTVDPQATPSPLPTLTATASGPASGTPAGAGVPTAVPDRGITPGIVVQRTNDDVAQQRDPQLDRAVQYVLTGK
jgi:carboxyl-terminal processing protease